MDPEPEQPRRRWPRHLLPGVVAVLLVADVLGAVGIAAYQASTSPPKAPAPSRDPHARAVPESAPPVSRKGDDRAARAGERAPRRVTAVRRLLARRAEAVRTEDREAFLSTVARGDGAFRAAQRRLFDNLTRLPLAAWEYDIPREGGFGSPESSRPARTSSARTSSARTSPARTSPARTGAGVWTPRLVLRYRYAGFDRHPVAVARHLTFAYGSHGWRVADTPPGTGRQVWDLGRLCVVRTDRALVLGVGTSRSRLREIAERVGRAVPVVSGVWGTDWPGKAVVLVPGSAEQAVTLSPDRESLAQIAAVATVLSGPEGTSPPGTGDRVVVNPENFSQLSALGRGVVIRHELTHVATRAFTDGTVPIWLIEGFADYVGYQGLELPARSIAPELSDAVRAGRMPHRLPTRAEFSGTAQHLTRAYESAWLACELIAERYGEQRLVRLYHVMGSEEVSDYAQRHGLRSVLGMPPDEFTAAWRSYARARLG